MDLGQDRIGSAVKTNKSRNLNGLQNESVFLVYVVSSARASGTRSFQGGMYKGSERGGSL